MSNSFLEVVFKFIESFLVLVAISRISYFSSISIHQAFAMALGMSLLDLIVFLIRKALKKDKKY